MTVDSGWIILPPWYVLLLHGLAGALLSAMFNLVVRSCVSTHVPVSGDLAPASRSPVHSAAVPPTVGPLTDMGNDVLVFNDSIIGGTAGGDSSPLLPHEAGSFFALPPHTLGVPSSPVKQNPQQLAPTDNMLACASAVRLVLRANYMLDVLVAIKVAAVLVFFVYHVDLPGGWMRYNVIGVATVCAGHLTIITGYLTRQLIDPAPARASPTQALSSLLRRVWESLRPNGNKKKHLVVSLDVRLLAVIGVEIHEVTYRACVFTLHGCLVPLLFTHLLPGMVVFAPYCMMLFIASLIVARQGRVALATAVRDPSSSPVGVFLKTLSFVAVVELLLTWSLQAAVVEAALWHDSPGLRSLSPAMWLGFVNTELEARLVSPTAFVDMLMAGGIGAWVPAVAVLV